MLDMNDLFKAGVNPRDQHRNHNERSYQRYKYDLTDIATLYGISVAGVRKAISRGFLVPSSLFSVGSYLVERHKKSVFSKDEMCDVFNLSKLELNASIRRGDVDPFCLSSICSFYSIRVK